MNEPNDSLSLDELHARMVDMSTHDKHYDEAGRRVAYFESDDDCGAHFFSPHESPDTAPPWHCTLMRDHDGPHVAHGVDLDVCAIEGEF